MRLGLRILCGSKPSLTRAARAASGAAWGSNTGTARRNAGEPRTKVACPVPRPSGPRIAPRMTAAPPSSAPATADPQEPAAPVEIPAGIDLPGDPFADLGAAVRRDRDAPNHPIGRLRERCDVADGAPEFGR